MIRKLFNILTAVLVLSGCAAEIDQASDGVGYLVLDLSCLADDTKSLQTDPSDFDIAITGQQDIFCKCADLPGIIELEPGMYSISASSPGQEPAAFDQPMFGGNTSFEIRKGETASVKLICPMLNMKVTVKPSAAFLSQVSSYTVTVSNGYGELVWTEADVQDGRAGYFTVAPLQVNLTGVSVAGVALSYDGMISEVEASDHHIISFDSF